MHGISVPIHIWLAALLVVTPIPEAWIKVGIALVIVLVLALTGS